MTTAVLFLTLVAPQGQTPAQEPFDAGKLVTKMMERYGNATTLTGTMRLTQSAGNQAGTLDTVIQYERPSKLYIRQVLNTASKRNWLVTADGKNFSYNKPEQLPGDDRIRLVETMAPSTGEQFDIRTVYTVVRQTLGDQAVPIDLAIARRDDQALFISQIVSYQYEGKVKLGDEEVHAITGQWREQAAKPKGTFELYINDAADLKRYVIRQTVAPSRNAPPMNVVTAWDVNFTVNGKPDPGLFKLVR